MEFNDMAYTPVGRAKMKKNGAGETAQSAKCRHAGTRPGARFLALT